MASRKTTDTTSNSGVSYATGSAASSTVVQKGVNITQTVTPSKISNGAVFNGHAVEVWADGAVWDTVSNKFLLPGTDFNPGDLQRI